MASFKQNNFDKNGKITYNAGIVKGIVVLAVSDVQGVSLENSNKEKLNSTKITFNNEYVNVDITIDIIYGYNVPDVVFNIQENVKHSIESMSRYIVESVDVHVDGVVFNDKVID